MSSFKIQFGNDVRRKSGSEHLTYAELKDIIIRTYVKPESISPDFDYKFKLAYEDSDEDLVTISNTDDLELAFVHHGGEVLKIVVLGAKKVDVKAKAFRKAFQTGLQLLESGAAEASIPHFIEALRLKKEGTSAYNLACAYSRLNQAPAALRWLRTALELGYQNFAWAIRDPDLANVRDTDEFVAIVRQMRSNSLPPCFRQFCAPRGQCAGEPSDAKAPAPTPSRSASPSPARPPSPARSPSPAQAPEVTATAAEVTGPESAAQGEALAQLAAMGFIDPEANRLLLQQNGGDLVKTVNQLLFA